MFFSFSVVAFFQLVETNQHLVVLRQIFISFVYLSFQQFARMVYFSASFFDLLTFEF